MHERNHLDNGRFLHDLGNWTANGASYSAGDGDEQYGVAVLNAAGGYIEQTFAVSYVRAYTLHTSVKPVSGTLSASQVVARIQDGAGNTVASLSLEGATSNAWQENNDVLGLAPGTTYTLRITNNSALSVRVDDVWLWAVPITRADIASRADDKLGRLASERSLSTVSSGSLSEGDYTFAVDAALRAVGAVDAETDAVDIRWLEGGQVLTAIDVAVQEMLEQLRLDYASEVDVRLGPRQENFSQKAATIGAILGSGGASQGSGRVIMRTLHHSHGFPE